jgi:hypothetical protein
MCVFVRVCTHAWQRRAAVTKSRSLSISTPHFEQRIFPHALAGQLIQQRLGIFQIRVSKPSVDQLSISANIARAPP